MFRSVPLLHQIKMILLGFHSAWFSAVLFHQKHKVESLFKGAFSLGPVHLLFQQLGGVFPSTTTICVYTKRECLRFFKVKIILISVAQCIGKLFVRSKKVFTFPEISFSLDQIVLRCIWEVVFWKAAANYLESPALKREKALKQVLTFFTGFWRKHLGEKNLSSIWESFK